MRNCSSCGAIIKDPSFKHCPSCGIEINITHDNTNKADTEKKPKYNNGKKNRALRDKFIVAIIAIIIVFLVIYFINLAIASRNVNESSISFNQGVDDYNQNDFQGAIDSFEKVIPEDTQDYTQAQSELEEAKTQLALAKIGTAENLFASGDYEGALDALRTR